MKQYLTKFIPFAGGFSRDLRWQMILPIPIFVVAGILIIWFTIPGMVTRNATDAAIENGQQIADQFKTIRGYYTNNIVKKAVSTGSIVPSIEHRDSPNAIPLPATMIHDLSTMLEEKDTQVDLYSAYPFPNRADRQLDDFQQQAWDFLSANPDQVFSRNEERGGQQVVRVAIADTMAAEGCVDCHNSHPDTPKADWKLGDVRGILEVTSVIDNQIVAGLAMSNKMVAGAVILGLILILITFYTTRSVTGPLNGMTATMRKLAGGELDSEIPARDRQDQIGDMAAAVEIFRDQAREKETLTGEQTRLNEQQKAHAVRIQEILEDFDQKIRQTLDRVGGSSEDMKTVATRLANTADASNNQISDILVKSGEAAQATQTVASAAEELSASVDEIGQQVERSTKAAEEAVNQTGVTNERVNGLSTSAVKIGEIVAIINDIAEQTNLLALNATIEAARAGDAGKGFAVVASEVKSLAEQTSKATEEISGQINEIQTATKSAVDATGEVGRTIREISDIAVGVAGAVEEQASATREIASNISQTAGAVSAVNDILDDVKNGARETDTEAENVQASSAHIAEQLAALHEQISTFLEEIKAA